MILMVKKRRMSVRNVKNLPPFPPNETRELSVRRLPLCPCESELRTAAADVVAAALVVLERGRLWGAGSPWPLGSSQIPQY